MLSEEAKGWLTAERLKQSVKYSGDFFRPDMKDFHEGCPAQITILQLTVFIFLGHLGEWTLKKNQTTKHKKIVLWIILM